MTATTPMIELSMSAEEIGMLRSGLRTLLNYNDGIAIAASTRGDKAIVQRAAALQDEVERLQRSIETALIRHLHDIARVEEEERAFREIYRSDDAHRSIA
jgi:hypothetical protein|tara:strand:- start:2287 stop:2586 length:300 start_codon:yes stop_codon:yes gene_type:complete